MGYAARIDPRTLNLGMAAIIRLKTTHEYIQAALRRFDDLPHIVEVHRVTGDDCFILKTIAPAPGDLATIVDAIGHFGAVTTSVILRSEPPKPRSRVLLNAGRR